MTDSFDRIIQENPALNETYQNLVVHVRHNNAGNLRVFKAVWCLFSIILVFLWLTVLVKKMVDKTVSSDMKFGSILSTFLILIASLLMWAGWLDCKRAYNNPEITAKNQIIDFIQPKPIQ